MATNALNLLGVLSETKRIINAHSRHFLALSILFLLPLSFSLILITPSLSSSFPYHSPLLTRGNLRDRYEHESLITALIPILYALSVILCSLFGTVSITHSTFHGFYGRPVKFLSSIKSAVVRSLALVVTLICFKAVLSVILLSSVGFVYLVHNALVGLLGFDFGYDNMYFGVFEIIIGISVFCLVVYLQVEWSLSTVVVTVEGKWSFSALRRSGYLVKGMRSTALSLMVLFGLLIGVFGYLCASLVEEGDGDEGWVSWVVILQAVLYIGFMTMLLLHYVASNVVLYMYCKALRDELALEIADEFVGSYVRLPFDDGKVPHVVYVV